MPTPDSLRITAEVSAKAAMYVAATTVTTVSKTPAKIVPIMVLPHQGLIKIAVAFIERPSSTGQRVCFTKTSS